MMKIVKGLLILLFVTAFGFNVFAATNTVKRVYISESFNFSEADEKQFFFLFSDGIYREGYSSNAVLFFSKLQIENGVSGNLYSFFSEVTFDNGIVDSNISITSFFSKVYMDNEKLLTTVIPILKFARRYSSGSIFVYDDTISPFFLKLIRAFLLFFTYWIFLSLRKSFFEQGSLALSKQYVRIVKSGSTVYFVLLSLILIFLMSVFGVLFSILLLLLLIFCCAVGSASLSVFIGAHALDFFCKTTRRNQYKRNLYLDMTLGCILLEVLNYIPYLNLLTNLFFIPIFALGILEVTIENGYIKKFFYQSPYAF